AFSEGVHMVPNTSSDDAGNGCRGPRAQVSAALLEFLSDEHGLRRTDEVRDLGGSSNLNLLFTNRQRRQCVARIYRRHMSESRLEAIHSVRQSISKRGIPCAELVPALDGKPWTAFEGHLVEVEVFVQSDECMDSWECLRVGLPWLGRIHSLLAKLNLSR